MRFKSVLFLFSVFVLIVARAPASLFDLGLAAVSGNTLRLAESSGSLWHGRGTLVARAADGLVASPWLALAWRFRPSGLLHGELLWTSEEDSGLRGELAFGLAGLRLQGISAQAPAAIVLPMFPGALAHAGWSGDLAVQAADWRCGWQGDCQGNLALYWRGASSSLLPGQRLGDYELRFSGDGKGMRFDVRTLSGEFRLSGKGGLSNQRQLSFDGLIDGPPAILKMLPSIGAGAVRLEGASERLIVRYPSGRLN